MQINFSQFSLASLQPKNDFEREMVAFLEDWFSDAKTIQVKTSGSTGNPKVIQVEKERMKNSAQKTCDFLGLKEGDSALLCLPIQYISGKMMMVRAIERKLMIQIEEPKTKVNADKNHFDFCAMTPLQVQNSLDVISSFKNLIIGGASVSENLKKEIFGIHDLKTHIFETYGMTETLSHIALKEIYPKENQYFKVLDGVNIETDDRRCLIITAKDICAEKIITNDIVELKNEKEFRFLGRWDHVINSGGVKIFPEEVESELKKHFLEELLVIGIDDEILGEKLAMVVESSENSLDKIKEKLDEISLSQKFFKPKEIFFLKSLPRTENGKILRKETKDLIIKSIVS